jgi:DNA-binding NtrC family response regulator
VEKIFEVLLVSCQVQNRRTLFGVFQDLPVNANTVSKLADAKEFMESHLVDMVFCEEHLPDGSYGDVLAELRVASPSAQFVLLMRKEEWEEYLEALRLGVEHVLRVPLLPIDVDLTLIRSMRHVTHELVSQ